MRGRWTSRPGDRLPRRGIRTERVRVDGVHLELGGEPWRVKGVSYGTRDPAGHPYYPPAAQAKQDLVSIAEAGFNTIRTVGLPPDHVLDAAGELDLRMLVGADYADWRHEARPGRAARRAVLDAGRRAIEEALVRCGDEPLVVAISVGEQVPDEVARAHGPGHVRDVLSQLVETVHVDAPGLLATHRGPPHPEVLRVPGQDLACLAAPRSDPRSLTTFLTRAQLLLGDLPLLVSDLPLGPDDLGLENQAESLRSALAALERSGVAGATIAGWTDQWAPAPGSPGSPGQGLTTVNRYAKPALAAASEWTRQRVHDLRPTWPSMTVVVAARDAAGGISACLEALLRTTYPDLEVVVVDAASTDGTVAVAGSFPVRVLEVDSGDLARARNAGLAAARGDVVAFLGATSRCHEEWPYHVALALDPGHPWGTAAAAGGPVLPDVGTTTAEAAVSSSPGGPSAVVVADGLAEQVAIGNAAFRSDALRRSGGFAEAVPADGDGVLTCWRLLGRGESIAYSPAAQVRAPRPRTVGSYLSEQRRLGQAEMLLPADRVHGSDHRMGQVVWSGPTFPAQLPVPRWLRPVIGEGPVGLAPHRPVPAYPGALGLALLQIALPGVVAVGLAGSLLAPWHGAWLLAPGLAVAWVLLTGGIAATLVRPPPPVRRVLPFRSLVALLHVGQPLARAWGRLSVDPAQLGDDLAPDWLGPRRDTVVGMRQALQGRGCRVRYGATQRTGDLHARVGPMVSAHVVAAVTPGQPAIVGVRYRVRGVPVLALALTTAVLMLWDAGRGAVVPALLATLLAIVERSALRHYIAESARAQPPSPEPRPGTRRPRGRHARPET